mmetsp:Transcript_79473/g.256937  ORF Transcript_79473/g.256937 Transcript_79473/m.256937 type:complete len:258 (+) Transcript_79473:808-1581(+)
MAFRQLLVAPSLLGRILRSLILQLLDHVLDEALDLCEDIFAELGARADGGGHKHGQLSQLGRLLLAREVADEARNLELREAGARRDAGGGLHQGDLVQAIAEGVGTTGHLIDGLLRGSESLQLLTAALRLRLEVLRLGHARLVQLSLGLGVCSQILGCGLEFAFGRGLRLAAASQALLGLAHILIPELDLVLDGLLEHLEVLLVRGLRLPDVAQLCLGLVQQALQGLDNVAALTLVNGCRRRSQIGVVLGCIGGLIR